jgi:hypothetical protein
VQGKRGPTQRWIKSIGILLKRKGHNARDATFVYVCHIPPRYDDVHLAEQTNHLNMFLSDICEQHGITCINNDILCSRDLFGHDGVHYNRRGQKVLCKNIIQTLRPQNQPITYSEVERHANSEPGPRTNFENARHYNHNNKHERNGHFQSRRQFSEPPRDIHRIDQNNRHDKSNAKQSIDQLIRSLTSYLAKM